MSDVERISVDDARGRAKSGAALLVCAYDDEQKRSQMTLEGAITMSALRSRLATLPKDQEIILYCA